LENYQNHYAFTDSAEEPLFYARSGYVPITGRSRDLIITGGLNVYPKEVEEVIDEIPCVLESALIALPDQGIFCR